MDELTMVLESESGEENEIKLSFPVPSDVPTTYANEVAIQALHTEFILSFFEVRLPIAMGSEASSPTIPTSLEAKCVSRIVLSVERIPAIINALSQRFKAFKDEREKELKEARDQREIQDSNN